MQGTGPLCPGSVRVNAQRKNTCAPHRLQERVTALWRGLDMGLLLSVPVVGPALHLHPCPNSCLFVTHAWGTDMQRARDSALGCGNALLQLQRLYPCALSVR